MGDTERKEMRIVKLRLTGGAMIETFSHVLCVDEQSLFAKLVAGGGEGRMSPLVIDCGHRDDRLVRLLVDTLRKLSSGESPGDTEFSPPEDFTQWRQLIAEARYWNLAHIEELIHQASNSCRSTITVGYHGTLTVGKHGHASELSFRRIYRLLVSGRVDALREVFGQTLNETRDGDAVSSRYTSRFYLTHTFLEQAFDALAAHRYRLVGGAADNPNTVVGPGVSSIRSSHGGGRPGGITDQERRFLHYAQFVFVRES